jgi:hypothetical protein
MVYNAQNHWGSRLCPSSGILNTRKHNVSENVGKTPTLLERERERERERANLNLPRDPTE